MTATTGDGPQPLGHVAALDGGRAIAIAAVIGLHAWDRVFPAGALGVDVFFVLSAFLISSLIIGEAGRQSGRFDFVQFYGRRAFRLLPALFVWLALVATPTAIAVHEQSSIR